MAGPTTTATLQGQYEERHFLTTPMECISPRGQFANNPGKIDKRFLMSLDIQNFGVSDPFANDTSQAGGAGGSSTHLIRKLRNIRNQQRNGRKSVTTVQGLDKSLDLKKMVRALKKQFSCNGTVIEDPEHGSIIQLQGDQRHAVKEFLEREAICSVDQIRIHGA
uniref:Eukaryotic translation initiation factor 1 n=1 Tax=Toxoplasma gondii TaxID=5811 RepID=Q38LF1_TOXGO|nr:eukaryotic translation initiation factor 1 [Toxoplasma gondii]